jgi:hypothetical protein
MGASAQLTNAKHSIRFVSNTPLASRSIGAASRCGAILSCSIVGSTFWRNITRPPVPAAKLRCVLAGSGCQGGRRYR